VVSGVDATRLLKAVGPKLTLLSGIGGKPSMAVVQVSIVLLAAFLFGAAGLTAWNAATIGDAAISARAGAWFFLGAAVLTVDLALSRATIKR
jgi:hypothetical protein